jgi:hypothetical protein
MCDVVIHVLSVELIKHILFAETFEGFDTRVLEVSTVILNFMDTEQRACSSVDDNNSHYLQLR